MERYVAAPAVAAAGYGPELLVECPEARGRRPDAGNGRFTSHSSFQHLGHPKKFSTIVIYNGYRIVRRAALLAERRTVGRLATQGGHMTQKQTTARGQHPGLSPAGRQRGRLAS